MKKILATVIFFIIGCVIVLAPINEFKLIPGDGSEGDWFGYSVSISGDYAIVGADGGENNGLSTGAAYVFLRNSDTTWVEEQKLLASDGVVDDGFGVSSSISGDYVIVSAPWKNNSSGTAYIFKKDGNIWVEEQKLLASDGNAGDEFGLAVSISEAYVIVGARGQDNKKGAAYIFKRDGNTWTEEQKLVASDGWEYDEFGYSVSISGDYTIVGARFKEYGQGAAYIFSRENTTWTEEQKLLASDGASNDRFGWSVSITSNYAIIGATGDDNNKGSAYIFKRDGTTWVDEQKLLASDGNAEDWFGVVSISEDYAIIGAQGDDNWKGAAYIFRRDGLSWMEQERCSPSCCPENSSFGRTLSISGNCAIVGAPYDTVNGFYSGSAYIFSDFVVGIGDDLSKNPDDFRLVQNYPNPFNPTTIIKYQILELSFVTIKIYDMLGREVASLVNHEKTVGNYEIEFDGSELTSGVYFYQLKAGSPSTGSHNGQAGQVYVETKKMVLLK